MIPEYIVRKAVEPEIITKKGSFSRFIKITCRCYKGCDFYIMICGKYGIVISKYHVIIKNRIIYISDEYSDNGVSVYYMDTISFVFNNDGNDIYDGNDKFVCELDTCTDIYNPNILNPINPGVNRNPFLNVIVMYNGAELNTDDIKIETV